MSKNTANKSTTAKTEVVDSVPTPAAAASSAPLFGGVQIVKKISNALMKGIVPVGGVVRVAGVVRKAIGKETNFGPYTEFQGDFAAKIQGVLFKSHKLLLPAVADMELASQYANALEQVAEGESARIEFVFDLVKVEDKDPKNANGFQWQLKTVRELAPEADRSLEMLSTSEKEKPLALGA